MVTVITFGTYDLVHVGHVRLLRRAAELGDRLVVGVSTDQLNMEKKGYTPVFPQQDRVEIIGALDCVDNVFLEESLELKRQYITEHGADVLVMGDDWRGAFDFCSDLCKVVYLERTPGISTSELRRLIEARKGQEW
ncbi:MAG: adenylyltransferase/cytidyltransferase family protein [Nitriliruptorales bacterium]|nr:adenylyltransferase/cytidyltransferase family protein [Nitriliruptorales bacterium]